MGVAGVRDVLNVTMIDKVAEQAGRIGRRRAKPEWYRRTVVINHPGDLVQRPDAAPPRRLRLVWRLPLLCGISDTTRQRGVFPTP